MWFGYYLGSLADYLGQIASFWDSLADQVQDVWVIGENLAAPFRWVAGLFYWLQDRAYALQDNWVDVWYWIDLWADNAFDLSDLGRKAGDLLTWLTDRVRMVRDIVRYWYPDLDDFMQDPRGKVIEYVQDLIGDALRVLDTIRERIRDELNDLIPYAATFFSSPSLWIVDRLIDYRYEIRDLLDDPRSWIMDKLNEIHPDLDDLVKNPAAFIVPRMIAFIKARLNQYSKQLTDLATDIISSLF